MKKNDESTFLLGLSVFSKDKSRLLINLGEHLKSGEKTFLVATPNPEQFVLSRELPQFKFLLTQFDLLLPDGIGLVWASQILAWRTQQPALAERIPGIEVVPELEKLAGALGKKCVVIGGRGYGADSKENAESRVSLGSNSSAENQPVQLSETTWWLKGYDDAAKPAPAEEAILKKALQSLKPAVVFVALGAPAQEQWLIEHRPWLESAGVKIGMTVGGSFDVLTGKLARAPQLVIALGLEWLYRLGQEPWRWRRQLNLVKFMGVVVKEMIVPTPMQK